MRRLPWRSVLLLAPVLALVALTVGCPNANTGSGEGGGAGGTGAGGEGAAPVKKTEMTAFESKGTGTLKGKVTLDGAPPEGLITEANKNLESAMQKHQDKEQCLAGTEAEKTQQEWKVNDGAVQNVVVFVRPPEGHYFTGLDKVDFPKKVTVDQPHCAFVPHVSLAFPSYYDGKTKKQVPTGQEVVVNNSAKMNHNTKWEGNPTRNPGANPILAPGKDMKLDPLKADNSTPIKLSCNIHQWMTGYIWALDTPYSAVTNEKGEYEIKNVPSGADLLVFAWHEPSQWVNKGESKGEKVTIKEGDNTQDFKVKAPAK
jgi:hypothetical protein